VSANDGAAPAPAVRAPAVRVAGLKKRFGYREVLRGIDIEIPEASCFAVFGHNGAGKSTLLRIIATYQRPTAGKVEVLGLDPAREGAQVRAALGVVFHDHFLRGDLSLEENLRFYGDLYGLDGAALSRANGLIERMGLGGRKRDLVRTFSQGMAKRATLIRSLLHDPRVWLLDEPFSGLDPSGSALLGEMILDAKRAGRTVVLVTHDVEIGLRLADDSVALRDGMVAARGKAAVEEHFAR